MSIFLNLCQILKAFWTNIFIAFDGYLLYRNYVPFLKAALPVRGIAYSHSSNNILFTHTSISVPLVSLFGIPLFESPYTYWRQVLPPTHLTATRWSVCSDKAQNVCHYIFILPFSFIIQCDVCIGFPDDLSHPGCYHAPSDNKLQGIQTTSIRLIQFLTMSVHMYLFPWIIAHLSIVVTAQSWATCITRTATPLKWLPLDTESYRPLLLAPQDKGTHAPSPGKGSTLPLTSLMLKYDIRKT